MAAPRPPVLLGRAGERQALDRLLENVRGGQSAVLIVRGEAGVGKTALLRHCGRQASGFRVARIAGVESEMELPFAGLHQLCGPMLSELDALPAPQQAALRVALGLSSGAASDGFLVALAALSLLSEAAAERPLLCLVDDVQWLDAASRQVLGFVARRLLAESVAIVLAVRDPSDEGELAGLPELALGGLPDEDARALLATVIPGRLDETVRDQLVAETHGNPLAILELPRELDPTQLAGALGPEEHPLSGRIEESYLRQLEALPEDARLLLVVAAAEPVGDPLLVWRAAERLGLSTAAGADADGLVAIGERVTFRHPLVRSTIYRSASPQERRAVHLALAGATDADVDADRRAWHLAAAAPGPDEEVAAELEQSAGRAQARGGLAAAAAFLRRSAALTRDPVRRVARTLTAAQASLHAGAFAAALELAAAALAGATDELQRARAELLRGQIAFASSVGSDAPSLLLKAAKRLEPLDVELARETYLDAWGAALFAGPLAATDGGLHEVSRAAGSAPTPSHPPRPSDLLLDGLAALVTDGRTAAAPLLRRATAAFAADAVSADENFRWGWLTTVPSNVLWDDQSWHAISRRQLELARDAGALARLPIDLTASAILAAWWGDFAGAAAAIAEADAVTEATQTHIAPYGAMLLAAFRGREAEATTLIESVSRAAKADGQGIGVQYARWVTAILLNGLGRYAPALAAAEQASEDAPELFLSAWALPELIEASVRSGEPQLGARAFERLTQATAAAGSDWALGIASRSRALLSEGAVAERSYHDAIDRLGRTRLRPELARAHLLYGEWLRREGRRQEAREQLHSAHAMLAAIGMEAFAERARLELLATGGKARKRTVETRDQLTEQEEQIARFACEGLSNPEIGSRLFLSPRTVEWHLGKVFTKLGISTRMGLHDALPRRESMTA